MMGKFPQIKFIQNHPCKQTVIHAHFAREITIMQVFL